MKRILIVGATSAIAHATARLFAARGASIVLVGRDEQKLNAVAEDLRTIGAEVVETRKMDVQNYERHEPIIDDAIETLNGLDLALVAHGYLPDQKSCEDSFQQAKIAFDVNLLSTVSILTHLANVLEQKGSGVIVAISSVAGDAGRSSNYVYGSTKGALSIFLQGLTARLRQSGVLITTVKPGYVDTPMTSTFSKNIFWAQPDTVARDIYRAVQKRQEVVYTPWFWRYVLLLLRCTPNFLARRFGR
jgi:short-subunit dehydrogenase